MMSNNLPMKNFQLICTIVESRTCSNRSKLANNGYRRFRRLSRIQFPDSSQIGWRMGYEKFLLCHIMEFLNFEYWKICIFSFSLFFTLVFLIRHKTTMKTSSSSISPNLAHARTCSRCKQTSQNFGKKSRMCRPCVKSGRPKCRCGKSRPSFAESTSIIAVCCKQCKTNTMIDIVNPKCPCGKRMNFGEPGRTASACKKCRTDSMIDVTVKNCGCGSGLKPRYAIELTQKPMHCSKCKTDRMMNVWAPRCKCGVQASFGLLGGRTTHCAKCKSDEMVDSINRCKCGSGKNRIYALSGNTATHCSICRQSGMKNVVTPTCTCGVQCSFGFPGTKATHCVRCKLDSMVDLKSRRCVCGSGLTLQYGILGETPTSCSKCKTQNMVNVYAKRCACGTMCVFGLEDGKPTHCNNCRTPTMSDVVTKQCDCGSGLRVIYAAAEGSTTATHCSQCKTDDMTNIRVAHCSCGKVCVFGYSDEKPTHCDSCKLNGMENVRSLRCECGTVAIFGYTDGPAIRCLQCKDHDMIDVKHNKCRHGSRSDLCTGNKDTCGKTLKGRSKAELYQAALVYMCLCDREDKLPNIEDFIRCLGLTFTPKNSNWTQNASRKRSRINVDAVFFDTFCFEYDGRYYHADTIELDTAKTEEILSAGYTILRVRDRLSELDVQHEYYRCVTVDERLGHKEVAKQVWQTLWPDTMPNDWPKLWMGTQSLADQAIVHFHSRSQKRITDFTM